jgi:hypothetical protein
MNESEVDKLKKALRKGELFEYIVGEKGYAYVCPYADTPTYDEAVFVSINEYYEHTKDSSIWQKFEAAWLAISANPHYSWFALYYLFLYARKFPEPKNQPIKLTEIIPQLVANIRNTKEALLHDQRWMGRGFPNGLWDNAVKMAAIINREFGFAIQLE